MIKHIVAPLTGNRDAYHVPLCALKLAEIFAAHVTVGSVSAPLAPYLLPEMALVSANAYGAFYESLSELDTMRQKRARRCFDQGIATTKTPIVSSPTCSHASANWVEAPRTADATALKLTRLADLILVDQPTRTGGTLETHLFEEAVFNARKPTIVVPEGTSEIRRGRVAVAWNGGQEATTAVQCALNFLDRKSEIIIVQVGDIGPDRTAAEELAAYLKCHGFNSTTRQCADHPASTGEVLLAEARAAKADIIIAGAYSHSRMREQIFGGVTRYLLDHSDIPLYMAH